MNLDYFKLSNGKHRISLKPKHLARLVELLSATPDPTDHGDPPFGALLDIAEGRAVSR